MPKSIDVEVRDTTDRVLNVVWSGRGDTVGRKRALGRKCAGWKADRISDTVFVIPYSINISAIHDAIVEILVASDKAVLTYPYSGSMKIRLYGQAAR